MCVWESEAELKCLSLCGTWENVQLCFCFRQRCLVSEFVFVLGRRPFDQFHCLFPPFRQYRKDNLSIFVLATGDIQSFVCLRKLQWDESIFLLKINYFANTSPLANCLRYCQIAGAEGHHF